MAGTITVDTIQSDSSYASTLTVATKANFASGFQVGGQDATVGSFRNRIQNGEININQRAVANTTNTASTHNGKFYIDRWKAEHYNVGGSFNPNISIIQTSDHPIKGSNGNCLEIKCNTTAATGNNVDFFSMSQHIEAQNISDIFSGDNGSPMTLSFWVKSNKPGTYCVQLRDDATGSGGYISFYEYTVVQSGVWEKKTISIPKPTYSSMPSTNASGLGIMFIYASGLTPTYDPAYAPGLNAWLNRGSQGVASTNQTNLFTSVGNYHRLTDVQLEVGTVATAFERRPYQQELALCQRYYQIASASTRAYTSDGYWGLQFVHKVSMRTTPTYTVIPATGNNSLPPTAQGIITADTFQTGVQWYGSGAGTYYAYGIQAQLSAEL